MAENINIGGRLHSTATGNVVAGANEIQDDTLNKKQSEINNDTNNTLIAHENIIQGLNSQNYESYSANEETTSIDMLLPELGNINTIYRLGNWDGNQYDTTQYAEYAWINTGIDQGNYVLLDVKNYGIDAEPTAGSDNLVKSGGIASFIHSMVEIHSSVELLDISSILVHTDLNSITGEEVLSQEYCTSPFIDISLYTNQRIYVTCYDNLIYCYDSSKNYIGRYRSSGSIIVSLVTGYESTKFIRVIDRMQNYSTLRVGLTLQKEPINGYMDSEPDIRSGRGISSKATMRALLGKVSVNSSDELFDRVSIVKSDIDTTTGTNKISETYWSSDFIPMDYNTTMFVTSWRNAVFVYDSSYNYLGLALDMVGVSLSNKSSSFENATYIRIVFDITDLNIARVGLSPTENPVKDYFKYDKKSKYGSSNIVLSDGIKNSINKSIKRQLGLIKDNIEIVYRNGTDVVTIADSVNRIDFIVKVNKNDFIKSSVLTLLNNYDIIQFAAVYGSYTDAIKSASSLEIERITTSSWTTESIYYKITKDGYLNINIKNRNESILPRTQIEDILYKFVFVLSSANKSSYFLHDWCRGDWTDSSNPTLTYREYKLRTLDWLYYKKGTIINGFLNDSGQTAHVDIWDAKSGTAIDISTSYTEDFEVVIPIDAKVLIWTTSSIQYPTVIDQVVDFRITEIEDSQINNIDFLKIASFNVGDFSGNNMPSGSAESKQAYRNLLTKINANILATQEDYYKFGTENVEDALYGMFKYHKRLSTYSSSVNNYNYSGFYSDFKMTNIRRVAYDIPNVNHSYFGVSEFHLGNKTVVICNIHFDWQDKNNRRLQINQVIDFCSKYEYSIILGDFNSENRINGEFVEGEDKYIYHDEWELFKNAGYSAANDGYFGVYNTCLVNDSDITNNWFPFDNIFVSDKIQIKNVNVITEEWMRDHKPIVSDLVIY